MKPRTALAGCLALLAASAAGVAAGDALDITYAGGLLTIRCAQAELSDVLEQIGTATGMALVLDDAVKRTVVTADVEAQPVQVVLERLLEGRGVSYAMSLSPDGQKVAKMFVGSGAESKSAAVATGGAPRPGLPVPAAHRAPEAPALTGPHLTLPSVGSDDDEEIDAEVDEPWRPRAWPAWPRRPLPPRRPLRTRIPRRRGRRRCRSRSPAARSRTIP